MARWLILTLTLCAGGAGAQTQARLGADAGAAFARADAAMTRQWAVTNAMMKRRDGQDPSRGGGFGYAAALLESQRAWLRYRDTECVIEGGQFAGGSAQGMAIGRCKARITTARTAELRRLEWRE